ncbi:hypothetical protein NKH18_15335 [Streptomyces sp. M10(2022)]
MMADGPAPDLVYGRDPYALSVLSDLAPLVYEIHQLREDLSPAGTEEALLGAPGWSVSSRSPTPSPAICGTSTRPWARCPSSSRRTARTLPAPPRPKGCRCRAARTPCASATSATSTTGGASDLSCSSPNGFPRSTSTW